MGRLNSFSKERAIDPNRFLLGMRQECSRYALSGDAIMPIHGVLPMIESIKL